MRNPSNQIGHDSSATVKPQPHLHMKTGSSSSPVSFKNVDLRPVFGTLPALGLSEVKPYGTGE